MRDGSWHPLPQAEGVAPHKVCTISVWVVKGVEEVGRGWGEQVLQVLFQGVDVLRA